GTNSVYALRVKTGFLGFKALAASAISTIDLGAVTVANEQMLIDESNGGDLTQLPLGSNLLASKVLSESGTLLGTVGNLLLATYPPVALHIATFRSAGGRTFSAADVTGHDTAI